jgi:hypothetical protein
LDPYVATTAANSSGSDTVLTCRAARVVLIAVLKFRSPAADCREVALQQFYFFMAAVLLGEPSLLVIHVLKSHLRYLRHASGTNTCW